MSTLEAFSPSKQPASGKKPAPGRKALVFLLIVAFLHTIGMTVVPFMTQQHLSNPNDLALPVAWMISVYGICQLQTSALCPAMRYLYGVERKIRCL
jgi:hypothetical protein